jgi:putative PIN family toxin of toxin-antitoxin system
MIPKRIVIDTNVCLDLFVFRDPRWALLLAALKNGTIEAVTREDCRMEWRIVLGYPHLPLNDITRQQSNAEFDALITCVAPEPRIDQTLPKCSDSDDQKFLELARDAAADVLITKDKALLKLARKTVRSGLFQIILPEAWETVSQLPSSTPAKLLAESH